MELAPDPLERLLAVCRLVLALSTDLLRPGAGFGDVPVALLGQHQLSRRQLGGWAGTAASQSAAAAGGGGLTHIIARGASGLDCRSSQSTSSHPLAPCPHACAADRHKGDPCQLFLQEICSHEPLAPTPHAKCDAPGSRELATLALRVAPAAAAAAPKTTAKGVVEMLVGGGGSGSTGEPYLEVGFEVRCRRGVCMPALQAKRAAQHRSHLPAPSLLAQGDGTLVLPRHSEAYKITLPSLLLLQPLADACPLELGGEAGVDCAASGLSAALLFGRGRRVAGSVTRAGGGKVAAIAGSWEGAVGVESLEHEAAGGRAVGLGGLQAAAGRLQEQKSMCLPSDAESRACTCAHPTLAGTLFDALQLAPPMAPTISLAEPGPRTCARLWSAVLEAVTALDAGVAARAAGRRGGELAAALPRHMRRALLYEVESTGR